MSIAKYFGLCSKFVPNLIANTKINHKHKYSTIDFLKSISDLICNFISLFLFKKKYCDNSQTQYYNSKHFKIFNFKF